MGGGHPPRWHLAPHRGCPVTLPLFQQSPLFQHGALDEAFTALRRDLIHEDGPRISTMRNYRFAIVQYAPAEEFRLRGEVQHQSLVVEGEAHPSDCEPCPLIAVPEIEHGLRPHFGLGQSTGNKASAE